MDDARMSDTPSDRCPRCDAEMTPIAYGYPGVEMFEAAERGQILLGGCVVLDGQPTSRCTSCETDDVSF